MASVSSNNLNSISQCLLPILRIQRTPSIPTVASIYLLMIPLIWESFSTCCCRSRLSLSSRRFWYCRRILLVCCSCTRSRRSYSSSFLWDIRSRSFRALISSSYSRTWGAEISDTDHRYACAHLSGQWRISILQIVSLQIRNLLHRGEYEYWHFFDFWLMLWWQLHLPCPCVTHPYSWNTPSVWTLHGQSESFRCQQTDEACWKPRLPFAH